MNLRYVRIAAMLYAFSFSSSTTIEKFVTDFFAVFHSEILAKEMRELINWILREIEERFYKELRCGDYEDMGIKIILYINGDAYHNYIYTIRPDKSSNYDDCDRAVRSFLSKMSCDLYPTLSAIANTERRILPANPDLSILTEDLRTKKYEIRRND